MSKLDSDKVLIVGHCGIGMAAVHHILSKGINAKVINIDELAHKQERGINIINKPEPIPITNLYAGLDQIPTKFDSEHKKRAAYKTVWRKGKKRII